MDTKSASVRSNLDCPEDNCIYIINPNTGEELHMEFLKSKMPLPGVTLTSQERRIGQMESWVNAEIFSEEVPPCETCDQKFHTVEMQDGYSIAHRRHTSPVCLAEMTLRAAEADAVVRDAMRDAAREGSPVPLGPIEREEVEFALRQEYARESL